jgi:transposase
MLSPDQVSGQILGHLGLVSATISKIGLIEQVDKRIPLSENHGSHVTMGERMAAMILNGLGFIDDRLYMFPEFLDDKPVARLFGKDLSAEHFNDDALGRCLDGIYEYGPTKLFSEIAFDIATEFGLLGKTARFDTTSISVFGEYNTPPQANPSSDKKEGKEPFRLAQGYSKDGRPDLKQMILTLATTGKSGFPIWASAHSGNTSDKEVLHRCASKMKKMTQGLKEAPSFLFVGDSAMYEKCARDSSGLLWLSRVPQVSNQAKELLSIKSEKLTWQELDKGYSISPQVTVYKNIKQRWLLVFSEQAFKREVKTLEKNILKEETTVGKQLWHLGNITFGCTSDANEALKPFKKGLKYHTVEDELEKILGYKGKGHPPKDAPK